EHCQSITDSQDPGLTCLQRRGQKKSSDYDRAYQAGPKDHLNDDWRDHLAEKQEFNKPACPNGLWLVDAQAVAVLGILLPKELFIPMSRIVAHIYFLLSRRRAQQHTRLCRHESVRLSHELTQRRRLLDLQGPAIPTGQKQRGRPHHPRLEP